ncbi:MAG: helix-turn-helix domain-containing protein [Victivallaceae bacterium]|nr:helix-turn-helix domain-containing protein [Victivallaceae bacterium]
MFDPDRLLLPEDQLRKIPGYNVIFRLEPTLRSRTSYKHRLHLNAKRLAQIENLVRKLQDELNSRESGYEAAALTLLLEIIVFVSRSYTSGATKDTVALIRVGKVISRLESSYADPWTLGKLAKLAAMSTNNLLRLFKAATGSSPIDYLIKIRLRNAAENLRTRRDSIADIAFSCGFRDSNYFSKKFRDMYGITPRRYRDKFAH